jgi:hypothetical protein
MARKDGMARKKEFEGFAWLTEQEVLGRMEGFRAVDGMEGSGLDERVFGMVGRKGPGAGKEIVPDRRGKSWRIWTVDLEPH